MSISPLLQRHYLRYEAELVPSRAAELLNEVFGQGIANPSQGQRLLAHYGTNEQVEQTLIQPLSKEEQVPLRSNVTSSPQQEVIYAMFDGLMLLHNDGYKETKIGRIFRSSQVESPDITDNESLRSRNRVLNSEYIAYEGHYERFIKPFEKLIKAEMEIYPAAQLVFITDGAVWMDNWVKQTFPSATHILDFYHAFEHLCDFATVLYRSQTKRQNKLEEWKAELRQGRASDILKQVSTYTTNSRVKLAKQAKELSTYLANNLTRMKYQQYRSQSWLIGSGAIESAARSIVQQRCKLSGQRWDNGLQPVLNLRCVFRSGKAKRMEEIINQQYRRVA